MDRSDEEPTPQAPIDPRHTLVLAVSTTVLAVLFLLFLVGDQVTAAVY